MEESESLVTQSQKCHLIPSSVFCSLEASDYFLLILEKRGHKGMKQEVKVREGELRSLPPPKTLALLWLREGEREIHW